MNVTPEELEKKRQELANAISPGLLQKIANLMDFYGKIPEHVFQQGLSLIIEMTFAEGVVYGGQEAFNGIAEHFAARDAEQLIKEIQKK